MQVTAHCTIAEGRGRKQFQTTAIYDRASLVVNLDRASLPNT